MNARARCLGVVENWSKSGCIIVRSRRAPRAGDVVADSQGRRLGVVVRVFGPVSAPFVGVRPDKLDASLALSILGKEVSMSASSRATAAEPARSGRVQAPRACSTVLRSRVSRKSPRADTRR